MAQARFYSSTARKTTLTDPVNAVDIELTVASFSGFPPNFPFTIIIDRDTIDEEVAECTGVSGSTLTVTRGVDGTTAVSHAVGAQVEHGVSARDFRESRQHEGNTENVHGLGFGSQLVGTLETQTLTNKTLAAPMLIGADANGSGIHNVADPIGDQDAVTRKWAETAGSSFVAQAAAHAADSTSSAGGSAASATQSADSAANSAASASAASGSESAAAASKAAAAASQAAALASEQAAALSESNTAGLVSAAAASAAAALTSEQNAAASETDAAASQVAAANSADAAAAALDSFDDRYLGSKNNFPTTDNDGNPLLTGALFYLDTDPNPGNVGMYVYDGSSWVKASAVPADVYTKSEADAKFALETELVGLELDFIAHDSGVGDTHGVAAGDEIVGGNAVNRIVKLTQAEYDLLTPVATTLYVIVG